MTKTPFMKKNQEMKVYGRSACWKIFEKRPHDIVRAYVTKENLFELRPLVKSLAENKKAYHIVETKELDAITKATHHEGVCLVVKTKKRLDLNDFFHSEGRSLLLCLEEVENPHNLGAIIRTCAHFGVNGVLYDSRVPVAQSPAALRTAEGGGEVISSFRVDDWDKVFSIAKEVGFESFATSSHHGKGLFDLTFPEKTLLFLGSEKKGLSQRLIKKVDHHLSIPGSGEVESLNVSNASAVILGEWFRQGQF